jgi:hypothetical protein
MRANAVRLLAVSGWEMSPSSHHEREAVAGRRACQHSAWLFSGMSPKHHSRLCSAMICLTTYYAAGRLLYVGISLFAFRRLAAHERNAGWWKDVRTVTTTPPYRTRAEAAADEVEAIKNGEAAVQPAAPSCPGRAADRTGHGRQGAYASSGCGRDAPAQRRSRWQS